MNILIVTGQIPYPPTSGGKKDVYNQIQALTEKGHQITLCIFDYSEKIEQIRSTKIFNRSVKNIFLCTRNKSFFSILRISPIQVASRQINKIEFNDLCKYMLLNKIDLIICENIFNMDIASKFAFELDIPIFLRSQNIESLFFLELAKAEHNFFNKFILKLESIKIKLYENKIYKNRNKNLQCVLDIENYSNEDYAAHTIKQYFLPAFCSGNDSHPSLGNYFAKRLLFVGSLNMAPNIEGIKWFIQNIWQNIFCEIPECELLIVGSSPGKDTYSILSDAPNCKFLIDKADISSEYSERPIFINPIRFGAGVSIKTIEAMRYGLPIVSTKSGARGSSLVAGMEAIITDDDNHQDFASNVIQLIRDDILRKTLGNNARKAFERTFSKKILINQLEIILEEETKHYKNKSKNIG